VVHVFADGGIDPARLAVIGLSQYSPAQSNDTAEGRNANRRVVITVLAADGAPLPNPSAPPAPAQSAAPAAQPAAAQTQPAPASPTTPPAAPAATPIADSTAVATPAPPALAASDGTVSAP
jgi:chemotaxis protein MotB